MTMLTSMVKTGEQITWVCLHIIRVGIVTTTRTLWQRSLCGLKFFWEYLHENEKFSHLTLIEFFGPSMVRWKWRLKNRFSLFRSIVKILTKNPGIRKYSIWLYPWIPENIVLTPGNKIFLKWLSIVYGNCFTTYSTFPMTYFGIIIIKFFNWKGC